jgi:hypothetical protein
MSQSTRQRAALLVIALGIAVGGWSLYGTHIDRRRDAEHRHADRTQSTTREISEDAWTVKQARYFRAALEDTKPFYSPEAAAASPGDASEAKAAPALPQIGGPWAVNPWIGPVTTVPAAGAAYPAGSEPISAAGEQEQRHGPPELARPPRLVGIVAGERKEIAVLDDSGSIHRGKLGDEIVPGFKVEEIGSSSVRLSTRGGEIVLTLWDGQPKDDEDEQQKD